MVARASRSGSSFGGPRHDLVLFDEAGRLTYEAEEVMPKVREIDHSYSEADEDWISISTARVVALTLHRNQVDKCGRPYGEHLSQVVTGVRALGGDEHDEVAAWFHDAVEDGHATYKMLRELGVSEISQESIEAVTKVKGEPNEISLQRVLQGGSRAKRLKLADLLSNTRYDRVALLRALAQGDEGAVAKIDRRLAVYQRWILAIMVDLELVSIDSVVWDSERGILP
jgi:(p)ppGpp synthase/HD superfamily hydrolase